MKLTIQSLFPVIIVATLASCSAEFVDLEAQDFPCGSDDDCSAEHDRACFAGRCTAAVDVPLPAYGVVIEDTSPDGSCASESPGADLYAVAIANADGPILAVGVPNSQRLEEGRGFLYGEGDANAFTDSSRWNEDLIQQGPSFFSSCPSFEPGGVVSLGCGGTAFFTFVEPQQSDLPADPATMATFSLDSSHFVLVYEYGSQCLSDSPPPGELQDSYSVRVCPRQAYNAGHSGWQVLDDDCALIGEELSGYQSLRIDAWAF